MPVALNYIFDVIVICFLLYSFYLNFWFKNKANVAKKELTNLKILMDLSQEGWIMSKRSDNGWVIEQASYQFCDILGYEWTSEYNNGVIGMYKDDLVIVYPHGTTYDKDKLVSVYINQLCRKDGKEIWVETSGKTITSDSGDKRISIIKNVEHIIYKFKQ